MGISVFPAPGAASKTMFRTTLTSGSNYTVPAGVTYLNVTLVGGGGGGSGSNNSTTLNGVSANGGEIVSSTLAATAGSTIAYAIGAGGAASADGSSGGSTGGTTTFTGATSALGGSGGSGLNDNGRTGTNYLSANNGASPGGGAATKPGGVGGNGSIIVEYWV